MTFDPERAGCVISRDRPVVRDSFGPTVEILTARTAAASAPALLRGTIPAGVVVPLHAHGDPETFHVLSGQIEGLIMNTSETRWVTVEDGQA